MALEHRLQILLDDDRHRRVSALARQRGTSIAAVIREAIDRGLPRPESRRAAAARSVLEATAMPVPPVDQLKAELDALRSRE